MDPDDLLVAVASGDQAAFAQLYDQLAPYVLGLSTQVIHDRAQAEEVTQEVFVEVWRTAPSFDASRGSARSWILWLARSRAIDRVRSDIASKKRDTTDFLHSATTWCAAEEEAVESLESQQVRALVDSIGEPHRTAIMLSYFQGLTHSEIAEATGVPLGTAKTRLRDGLKKLRQIVHPHLSATGAAR